MTYLRENWQENKEEKLKNNQTIDGEKRARNEELYGLATKGMSIKKLAQRYKISRNRVYSIIIDYERIKRYKPNFGKVPTRFIRHLVKGEIVSLEHAKLIGLEKLVSIEGIGPITAARIMTGEFDF